MASILDQIANVGTAGRPGPIAAFLVGREKKRLLERQENQDAQAAVSQDIIDDFRKAQTERLRNPDTPTVEEWVDLTPEQKKGLGIPDTSFAQRSTKSGQVKIDDAPRTGPGSVTNVTLPGAEPEADKALGKSIGERAASRIEQAQASISNDADLDRLKLALDRGAQTGFGEEFLLGVKGLGSTVLGIEFSEASTEQEVIRKIGSEMALRLRNPSSGLGLTGNTSNKDLDFLKGAVPGLEKSEGGNLKMIEYQQRLNKMKRDIATEQARIRAENGGRIPRDLDSQLMRFADNYELFTDAERAELEQITIDSKSLVERAGSLFDIPENSQKLDEILSR